MAAQWGELNCYVRMSVKVAGAPDAFQADDEGSIPFTRSNTFNELNRNHQIIPISRLLFVPINVRHSLRWRFYWSSRRRTSSSGRTAALYKRPTKAFEEAITPGGVGVRFLRLEGAVPIEGGVPLIIDNKIVGAIGMSGGTGVQDGIAAKAGADALK
jgi:hypothetical protein